LSLSSNLVPVLALKPNNSVSGSIGFQSGIKNFYKQGELKNKEECSLKSCSDLANVHARETFCATLLVMV